MRVENLDYKCYRDAVQEQRDHQEDWLRVGYAPKGFYLKDHCLIKAGGVYHLFHIAGTPNVSCCLPGNEVWLGHATTKDFLKWQTHEPCLYISSKAWDNGHVIAPYVIERDSRYWMLYTGCSVDNTQRIGLAVSDDLFSWQKVGDRPILRPEQYDWAFCPTEKGAACRDPHVLRIDDQYLLYYTAVTKQGNGCVALATSEDLVNWQDQGPCYIGEDVTHCESSNVQEVAGKYHLFFGGHIEYWSYVVSDTSFRWANQRPRPLAKGVTGMEVIARKDRRWLVSFFRLGKGHRSDGFRLFLGIIDWSDAEPGIHQLSSAEELNQFDL